MTKTKITDITKGTNSIDIEIKEKIESIDKDFKTLNDNLNKSILIIEGKIKEFFNRYNDKYTDEDLETLKVVFSDVKDNNKLQNTLFYCTNEFCFKFEECVNEKCETKLFNELNLKQRRQLYDNCLDLENNFIKNAYMKYLTF